MKGDNPPHQRRGLPTFCSQTAKQIWLSREAAAEVYYFPPIRDGGSAPLPPSIPAAQQTRNDSKDEDSIFYFPPIRDGDSAPLPPSIPAAQQTKNNSEDEDSIFYFPPIKEGNSAPLRPPIPGRPQASQRPGSQKPPLSSKEEPSQSQHRQQPNIGLGRANIVNTTAVRPYTLYRSLLLITNDVYFYEEKSSLKQQDPEIQDVADRCPMKKRRVTSRDAK